MFKILDKECTPTRGSKYSACVDLKSREDITIKAGETKLIPLGICLNYDKFPIYLKNNMDRHYLQLMVRSSLGKNGLILPNGVGVIDMDYRDEIKMIVHNPIRDNSFNDKGILEYDTSYVIKKGDRVGQITLLEHKSYWFDIDTDVERCGGFGSSGK